MQYINFNPLIDELKPVASAFDDLINDGISSILGASMATSSPRVNFIKHEDNYLLELSAPGMNKSDFNLHIEKDTLTVSVDKTTSDASQKTFIRREFSRQSFNKTFHIPKDVDNTAISAAYENGVLIITLPKISKEEREWSRTIEIS